MRRRALGAIVLAIGTALCGAPSVALGAGPSVPDISVAESPVPTPTLQPLPVPTEIAVAAIVPTPPPAAPATVQTAASTTPSVVAAPAAATPAPSSATAVGTTVPARADATMSAAPAPAEPSAAASGETARTAVPSASTGGASTRRDPGGPSPDPSAADPLGARSLPTSLLTGLATAAVSLGGAWWLFAARRRRPAVALPDEEATRELLSRRTVRRARMRTTGDPVIASLHLDDPLPRASAARQTGHPTGDED